jgi:parvulin-like peptidyl-prolyl isomerase
MLRAAAILILTTTVFGANPGHGAEGSPATSANRTTKLSDLFGDEVVARGKGVEVKRSHLEEAFTAYKANLAARGQQIPDSQRTGQEAQLLQRLVVTQILTNRVTDADRTVAKGLADKFTAESKKNAPSEEAFYRQLKAMGLSPEQFDRRVTEQALAEAVIQREITANIKIDEPRIREFYNTGTDLLVTLLQTDLEKLVKDPAAAPSLVAQVKERMEEVRKANLARLEQPEKVRVCHVFFATFDRKTEAPLPDAQKKLKRQQMDRIRQRAVGGEDFAKLAQEFSEDRALKQTGGEYTFGRDDPFAPEFKAAAFSLEPGKISDVVATPNGLHVIKLLEKIPPKKVEFEKVSGDLKEFLTQQEVQRAMPDFFARLIKESSVEILDPKYKEILGTGSEPKKAALGIDSASKTKTAFVEVRKPKD